MSPDTNSDSGRDRDCGSDAEDTAISVAIRWLRAVKLLLRIALLAVAVWQALVTLG